jgi:hypothetical protein
MTTNWKRSGRRRSRAKAVREEQLERTFQRQLKEKAMGVVIGMVIGYALGSQAGQDAWPELQEAWKTIVASEEVRDMVAGGVSMARDLLGRRGELFAGVLGLSDDDAKLQAA